MVLISIDHINYQPLSVHDELFGERFSRHKTTVGGRGPCYLQRGEDSATQSNS